MVARINTVAFHGVDVQPIDVQVQISAGMPAFTIVGLPDKAVAESKERVRAALHALGIALPPKRLTVNLAPADVAKEGSHFDLPIALGLLAAMGVIPAEELRDTIVLGELALDAGIRAVAGVLPAALHAAGNDNRLICPQACGGEAAWVNNVDIIAPADVLQLINHIKGTQILARPSPQVQQGAHKHATDLADVRGQETAKRALEIAAAGGHNLLMLGPPGSGKSMLASCLPGILPPLSAQEALEVSMIHSLAGSLPDGGLVRQRPFRDPHHSASQPALIGGGTKAKPGEISLAHHGVLFLDELPEFARGTLESLRQPLETGRALVARVNNHVTYPARFQLIAAMNPCRCGYLSDPQRACTKAPRCAADYQAKISGPLLDRMDMQVDVPPVSIADLAQEKGSGESSSVVAARVLRAREAQAQRFADSGENILNAYMSTAQVEDRVTIVPEGKALLTRAAETMGLSARGYHRVLRVARTIADLDQCDNVNMTHMAEALSYRQTRLSN